MKGIVSDLYLLADVQRSLSIIHKLTQSNHDLCDVWNTLLNSRSQLIKKITEDFNKDPIFNMYGCMDEFKKGLGQR